MNIARALDFVKVAGVVIARVGCDSSYASQLSDQVEAIPTVDEKLVTPHAEAFQIVRHYLLPRPKLQLRVTK